MSSPCYGSFCPGRLGGGGTDGTLLMGTILYKTLPEINHCTSGPKVVATMITMTEYCLGTLASGRLWVEAKVPWGGLYELGGQFWFYQCPEPMGTTLVYGDGRWVLGSTTPLVTQMIDTMIEILLSLPGHA